MASPLVVLVEVEPVPAERSGVEVGPRRADRFCCAIIIAGNESAMARNKIRGTKNLFLTRPPKTVLLLSPLVERLFQVPGSGGETGTSG